MVNNGFVTYGDEESIYREMTQQDPQERATVILPSNKRLHLELIL